MPTIFDLFMVLSLVFIFFFFGGIVGTNIEKDKQIERGTAAYEFTGKKENKLVFYTKDEILASCTCRLKQ